MERRRSFSFVLIAICACEMVFWMQACAGEPEAAQMSEHLSNTKEIHITQPTVCADQKPLVEVQHEANELGTAQPEPQPEPPKSPPSQQIHKQPPIRRSSPSIDLQDAQPQEKPPRPKYGGENKQTGTHLICMLAALFAALRMLSPKQSLVDTGLGVVSSCFVWGGILALPLVLMPIWATVFPADWCLIPGPAEWPSPLGLSLGLLGVAVGQVFVLLYHWLRRAGLLGELTPVQTKGAVVYQFSEGVVTHLAQPEGFVLMGGYLSLTWMLRIMPDSYFNFHGGIQWHLVLLQLLITDATQAGMHMLEHQIKSLYKESHKPHHRFTNPRLFDAFNGSWVDTCLMILVPLLVTAQLVHCNLWSYIAFGTLYANWLTLIHSEVHHPWDWLFRALGMGTAADHHVHHRLFVHNYGHTFMYWDRLCCTYKDPQTVEAFNMK